MKYNVFRYELMVKDMTGGGINPVHSPLEQLKDIDGRITFKDKESGLLCCYALHEGFDFPMKYYVPSSWCEEVEL